MKPPRKRPANTPSREAGPALYEGNTTGSLPRAISEGLDSLRRNVPAGYGDLPSRRDRRDLHPFEAALCLDRPLRKLSRASGAIDRALAVRLSKLRQSRDTLRLGYSSFGDYARERLGMSERVAHDLARLGKALDSLPRLDQALQRGTLTWSAAFQVARVARASDEHEWVEWARANSVRELKAHVAETLAARARDRTAPAGTSSRTDDASGESNPLPATADLDRRTIRKRVLATRLQARCWYAATELCEQLVAAPMSPLEPPEYLLAEFLSGAEIPARESDGQESDGQGSDGQGSDGRGSDGRGSDGREPPQDRLLESDANRVLTGPVPYLELDEIDAALSRDVSAALAGLDEELPLVPHELDRSMRILVAGRRSLDLDLGRLLRNFGHLGLCRQLGFPTFSSYVEERLGISTRRAGLLSRLARGLDRAPLVHRAVRRGRIGVVAALELCRLVLDSTEELHWVERAESVSVARLRREIDWGLRRRVLTGGIRRVLPPPRGQLPTELDAVVEDLIGARQTFAEHSTTSDETEVPISPDRSADGDGQSDSITVVVPLRLSMTASEQWEDARQALSEALEVARPRDCDVLHHVALDFLASYLPDWLVALKMKDPIAIRERFRCAAPGCTQRCGSGHHIQFKSQGGPDEAWNLVFLCFEHHILGVHAGVVRVHGRAPDQLVFELGIDKSGTPLETWINGWRAVPPYETHRDAA